MALSVFFAIRMLLAAKHNLPIRKIIIGFFVTPFAITVVVFVAYLAFFYSCQKQPAKYGGYGEIRNDTFCHISHLPFDNALAYIYGSNILENNDDRKALSWYPVDRPPLQIGATLPVIDFSEHQTKFYRYTSYYVLSVFLQLSWIGVVWGGLKKLKIETKYTLLIIVGFALTGFFYVNSVFIWPKLIAASLTLLAVFLLIDTEKLNHRVRYMPVAALALSLGMLSHSGVIFTVIPVLLYTALRFIKEKNWRKHLKYPVIAGLLVLLLLIPWQQYKSSINKNDRLLEWHLAGIEKSIDPRPTSKTIIEEYRKLNFRQWVGYKQENLETLVVGNLDDYRKCVRDFGILRGTCTTQRWRALTFFSTLFAFEAFILGVLVLAYKGMKRQLDKTDVLLSLLIVSSLLIWSLLMFLPGSNIVHQGSYATMMLGFILFAKVLSYYPGVLISITLLQTVAFCLVWVKPFL